MGIHPTWASCANVDFVGLGIQCYESTSLCQCADQTLRVNNKKTPFWAMVGVLKKGLGMPECPHKSQEKGRNSKLWGGNWGNRRLFWIVVLRHGARKMHSCLLRQVRSLHPQRLQSVWIHQVKLASMIDIISNWLDRTNIFRNTCETSTRSEHVHVHNTNSADWWHEQCRNGRCILIPLIMFRYVRLRGRQPFPTGRWSEVQALEVS